MLNGIIVEDWGIVALILLTSQPELLLKIPFIYKHILTKPYEQNKLLQAIEN